MCSAGKTTGMSQNAQKAQRVQKILMTFNEKLMKKR